MNTITNIFFYVAIILFLLGVLVNFRSLVMLPGVVPKKSRWPIFVWIVMLVGLGQWFKRETYVDGVMSVDTSASIQIGSIVIAGLVLLIFAGSAYQSKNLKYPLLLLLLYGLEGLLTSPISDVPALSVFKATSVVIAILLTVMSVKVLDDEKTSRILFNTVFIYFVIIAFLSILGGLFLPEITHRANKGVFGFMLVGWPALNSNSLSYVAAVVFVISLRRLFIQQKFNRRLLYIGTCSVGLITLLLAQGRTSIISSTLAILFMSFFIKEMRSMKWVLLLGGIVMAVLLIISGSVGNWTDTVAQYMQRGVSDEQIATMSGRTEAWELAWQLFLDSPITGYGFYAAGKTLVAPHNAYFTILLNGGLLGFIPWLLGILGGMFYLSRHLKEKKWNIDSEENNFYKEILAVMIVQIVRTITGQDLTIHSYSMLMFFAALVYIIARENNPNTDKMENKSESDKTKIVDKFKSVTLRKAN